MNRIYNFEASKKLRFEDPDSGCGSPCCSPFVSEYTSLCVAIDTTGSIAIAYRSYRSEDDGEYYNYDWFVYLSRASKFDKEELSELKKKTLKEMFVEKGFKDVFSELVSGMFSGSLELDKSHLKAFKEVFSLKPSIEKIEKVSESSRKAIEPFSRMFYLEADPDMEKLENLLEEIKKDQKALMILSQLVNEPRFILLGVRGDREKIIQLIKNKNLFRGLIKSKKHRKI